jgi:hypothetical protein
MPSWYQEIEAAVEKLVHLGMKISAYAYYQAVEVRDKLHALASTGSHIVTFNSIIEKQLIRDMKANASSRCDNALLSVFLALVDSWLRSCEEYVRRHSNIKRNNLLEYQVLDTLILHMY